MLTLWDLIEPVRRAWSAGRRPPAKPAPRVARAPKAGAARRSPTMQERYDAMVAEMLSAYGVKVRKWRKGSSGVARETRYSDGTVRRTLESPRPTGPMSAAIFLHEIGHHAIGFGVHSPRCLEEYHAWAFAVREMEARGLNVTEAVRRRVRRSLEYAVRKAVRRGLKHIPPELTPYV
ncbi:MAG: hypothetical protein HRU70_09730 [Phycisphaeraceae bacterium]|nr:MAG: hypothetical protein HRU70_09730 [Phycisphaeraceae bacterium]